MPLIQEGMTQFNLVLEDGLHADLMAEVRKNRERNDGPRSASELLRDLTKEWLDGRRG